MRLTPPELFDLDATVRQSSISTLAPLRYDAPSRALSVVLAGPGRALALRVTQEAPGRALMIDLEEDLAGGPAGRDGRLAGRARAQAEAALRDMLRLDEDLSLLHALTDRDKELSWVRRAGAGRILRSATAFEDLVKCLLLGRCAAARARALSQALCARLGAVVGARRGVGARAAFPDAAALARQSLSFYREIGAGALAESLRALARRCSEGALLPESLRRGPLSRQIPAQLSDEDLWALIEQETEWEDRMANLLLDLPGFGVRSTCLMLPLLGCYDALELTDQVLMAWVRRRPGRARPQRPRALPERPAWRLRMRRQILRRVSSFAHYRALALRLLLNAPPA